jgi:SAM-dependent methyltransferase
MKATSHRSQHAKVPFRERAFVAGNVIGVNGYRVNQVALKQLIAASGYQINATPHFMICTKADLPAIVVHRFAPQEIDADLGHHFMEELKPLGMLARSQDYGDVFGAVVGSLSPNDPQRAWYLFGTNTLHRYHRLLALDSKAPLCGSPIDVFSTLYRRVCEFVAGDSLLDAGCSFGFLPLVVAERVPSLTKVAGVDIQADPFPIIREMAAEQHLTNVQFIQADLLADDFASLGRFATVTALHVLEHFSEVDMYRVLTNLLKVAVQRLIIAVPYESSEPEPVYGHKQLFSRARLEAVGHWCLERSGGQSIYEDCAGGLLLIDLHPG